MTHGTRVVEPVDNETTVVTTIDSVPVVNEDGLTVDRQRVRVVTEPGGGDVEVMLVSPGGAPVGMGNPLPVSITDAVLNVDATFSSKVSTLNSSFIPLAANAVFVGEWEDCLNYAALTFTINTDQNSAQNGAVVQWSDDGVNVLSLQYATVQPLPTGVFFVLAPQGKFFRVVYTNGPVAQTVLRSEVSLLFTAPAVTQGPIANPATDLNIATSTTAHLKGRVFDGPFAGVWQAIGTDGLGKLLTLDQQAATDAAAALLRHEQAVVELQGVNTELDTIAGHLADDVLPSTVGVRGWLRRIYDTLTGGIRARTDIAYYASPAGGTVAFNITTGVVTIAASGLQSLALMENPANSGVDCYLDVGEFGSSGNTTFQRLRNATILTRGTALLPSNMGGGANAGALRMYAGGSNFTFSGGTVAKTAHIAAFQQYLTLLGGRVRLRPGQSLLWQITGPGGLGGSLTASVFFEYWERPAT